MEINLNISIIAKPGDDGETLKLLRKILNEVSKMSAALDNLTAKVTAEETVISSAIALITGIKAALDEALAANDTAAIQALSDKIGADTQALADAVTANTPAA